MQPSTSIDYKALYEAQKIQIIELTAQLQQLKKMIFGSRHESFNNGAINPAQLSLGIEQPAEVLASSLGSAKKITYIKPATAVEQKPLVHPGRMKLPEHLRRQEVIINPVEDITGYTKIGEEITEVLEYEPGQLFVKKYVRPKYARPSGQGIVIGHLPVQPLEKAIAGPSLLAQIIIDKYVDHLPLHRQMQRFERSGVKLPYSTLTDWVGATCKLIAPLYEALKKQVLQSDYLHVDETPIKVMDKDKKGTTHRGYYWVYQNTINGLVFFDYHESRGRDAPLQMLEGFKGHLQTDGYNVYNFFDKTEGITLLHCMAHARRMFHEAMDNDQARASHALTEIQKLYHIEAMSKEQGLNFDQIKEVRQQKSVPILQTLGVWMKEQYMQATPRSTIGKALGYSIERWEKLCLYTTEGKLNIDNNPVENSIRPVALGRKNYLFAGSHEAAQRSAMLYSLMGTCKMHNIEPYSWLVDVLQKIASHPINKIAELLPQE